jgi:hypothetical protein
LSDNDRFTTQVLPDIDMIYHVFARSAFESTLFCGWCSRLVYHTLNVTRRLPGGHQMVESSIPSERMGFFNWCEPIYEQHRNRSIHPSIHQNQMKMKENVEKLIF